VPVERVEIRNEKGELVFSTRPGWPALTELVSGLLETPRDGTQWVQVASPVEGRIEVRLHGADGDRAELTEIEVLGRLPGPE
jgi:hypothetical protein